jgi:hypothetical protein
MATKVQVSYRTHNRTLFSCSSLDDLLDEDKWSEVAYEEGMVAVHLGETTLRTIQKLLSMTGKKNL